jgi:transcriptional regulator with XRE-family HTH domain
MTRLDDVEWRRREELRSLLTALRSRWGGNSGKRLRQDDAAILSGLSTRRYAALERGTVENPSLDLIENVASGLHMTPAERSALHVLSRGQDPPMPPAAPGGEWPEIDPGQRELIARAGRPSRDHRRDVDTGDLQQGADSVDRRLVRPGPLRQAESRAVLVHARG